MALPAASLADLAHINPPVAVEFGDDDLCTFVPMDAVDESSATINKTLSRPYREVARGFTRFVPNDVLIAKITPCMENGKCAVASHLRSGVGFGSTEFHVLRASKAALPEWLFYYWRRPETRRQAQHLMTGTAGQRRISTGVFDVLRLPVISLAEQERRVRFLRSADRLCQRHRFAIQLNDSLLQASFLRLFGEPTANLNIWPAMPLGEFVAAFEGGISFNPVGENEDASEWRVLKISSITTGEFLPSESKPISPRERFDERLIVRRGDLIMSRANTAELVGAIARARREPPKVLLPDKLWRLRFIEKSNVLPDFVLYCLRTPALRAAIQVLASGTSGSMKNISKDDARSLRIPVPPLPLQQQFVSLVHRQEELRMKQRSALQQANYLFGSLLDSAFQ